MYLSCALLSDTYQRVLYKSTKDRWRTKINCAGVRGVGGTGNISEGSLGPIDDEWRRRKD